MVGLGALVSALLAARIGEAQAGATLGESLGDGPQEPWGQRHAPGSLGELGCFLGAILPARDHNLHRETKEQQRLGRPAQVLGIRVAAFPLPYVGAELESMVSATTTWDKEGATLWALRAHGVAQLPLWRVSPFLLGGGGRMGIQSSSLGDDADPLLYFGAGVKLAATASVIARADLRDNLTQRTRARDGALVHHPEVLVGLSFRFPKETPSPQVGPPPLHREGHPGGSEDRGTSPTEPDQESAGPPRMEWVGDESSAEEDRSSEAPSGSDAALPGVIARIDFEVGKATIAPERSGELATLLTVLNEHPGLRIRIVADPADARQQGEEPALGPLRVEAVRRYLVEQGIADGRIETLGSGRERRTAPRPVENPPRSPGVEIEVIQDISTATSPQDPSLSPSSPSCEGPCDPRALP